MNKSSLLSLIAVLSLGASALAVDDYQVTGPITELTDSKIVVQKGKERLIARTADAKVTGGELKVGSKVTVHYTMTAKSVEVKDATKK